MILDWLKSIAKAVTGGAAALAVPQAVAALQGAPLVWSMEWILASFFGVGIAVWAVPNKPFT